MTAFPHLPRPFDADDEDDFPSVLRQLDDQARDVRAYLERVPPVAYVTVTSDASAVPLRLRPGQEARAVTVARVVSGTVSAAPYVDWAPSSTGITITTIGGVTSATVVLRIEV